MLNKKKQINLNFQTIVNEQSTILNLPGFSKKSPLQTVKKSNEFLNFLNIIFKKKIVRNNLNFKKHKKRKKHKKSKIGFILKSKLYDKFFQVKMFNKPPLAEVDFTKKLLRVFYAIKNQIPLPLLKPQRLRRSFNTRSLGLISNAPIKKRKFRRNLRVAYHVLKYWGAKPIKKRRNNFSSKITQRIQFRSIHILRDKRGNNFSSKITERIHIRSTHGLRKKLSK